jgi:hypothetical protein
MKKELTAALETALLDETERALNEFVQAAVNCGISKGQMGLMLQRKANDLVPPVIVPEPMTMQ